MKSTSHIDSSRKLAAVHAVSQRLQLMHRPDDMAQEVIRVLEQSLEYEYAAVLMVNSATGEMLPLALSAQGRGDEFVEQDKRYVRSHGLRVGDGITGWVAAHGETVLSANVRDDPRYHSMRDDIRSELCVPIRAGGTVIGVFNIETERADAYCADDRRVLETVATQFGVAYVATIDVLTSACNRSCFMITAGHELKRARRFTRPMSVLVIDVDDLKGLNDEHGHAAGDIALRHVADVVHGSIRDADMLGRLGGDEFAVVLPETDSAAAETVAGRIAESLLRHPASIAGRPLPVTVSCGYASLEDDVDGISDLLDRADASMYRRKKARR
jgi:diguanylate cyclase (GGDEF)-like protein